MPVVNIHTVLDGEYRVVRESRIPVWSQVFTGYMYCTRMKRSMELGHVFLVTFGAAVRGIGGMPDR